jgi:DnaJ-class molecular chaperone
VGDLYAMLGLADRTYEAGDSEIKQSYKKMALMYHPDKLGDSITESDKEVWLKI